MGRAVGGIVSRHDPPLESVTAHIFVASLALRTI
jgi:hypothetical protein